MRNWRLRQVTGGRGGVASNQVVQMENGALVASSCRAGDAQQPSPEVSAHPALRVLVRSGERLFLPPAYYLAHL